MECKRYEHIEEVVRNPIFGKLAPKVIDWCLEIEAAEESCQELSDRGEHGEWHSYEMTCDSVRPKIWNHLLNRGFIRVGEVNGKLHFEGRPNHLKQMHQKCLDLAEGYAAQAVFEPQK